MARTKKESEKEKVRQPVYYKIQILVFYLSNTKKSILSCAPVIPIISYSSS
jgi:hypothetical protein